MDDALEISLDGRTLKAAENTNGEVSGDTLFEFEQDEEIITATYSGGEIQRGYLIGTLEKNRWEVRYVQINRTGETSTGHSIGELKLSEDGRVLVEDDWEWESRAGGGHSVLEEVKIQS